MRRELCGDIRDASADDRLLRPRRSGDRYGGSIGCESFRDRTRRECADRPFRHIDHGRGGGIGKARPVQVFRKIAILRMAGDVLQASHLAPLGQRSRQPGRGALRGGDAGNDLDGNAGGPAGGNLFAGAAEDQGIAALEAHHPLAAFGQRDHERVDLVLPAGGGVAGLAHQHLLRFAARELEDLVRNQIIEQDNVRRLQRAYRAQGEQFWIAGPRADQGDAAGIAGGRVLSRALDKIVEIGLLWFAIRMGERVRRG